jgi:hypothetical protein
VPVSPNCPKCSGAMTEGFVIDKTHGGASVSTWMEGEPVRSIWFGVKARGTQFETRTWRCRRCGFLESYAPSE